MTTPVLDVEGLKKSYGDDEALKGVDLRWDGAGILGLLGPNGAGKTTLVETLEGLRTPTAGRVSVLGLDPTASPRLLKERLGVQLQSTSLPPDLTVGEVVALFASFYPKARDSRAVLSSVGLSEKVNSRVRNLSGGQRQRLALSLAVLHDPSLVLLDEPTTGLDPAARRALYDVIRALRDEGRAVLLTTHYIEEAELLCDRVVVLRKGEIVADGAPFELLRKASGVSTVWVEVDGILDPSALVSGGATLSGREGRHLRFSTPDPTGLVVALSEVLRSQSLSLLDLRMKRPTLEDVYLELVGPEAADGEEVAA